MDTCPQANRTMKWPISYPVKGSTKGPVLGEDYLVRAPSSQMKLYAWNQ